MDDTESKQDGRLRRAQDPEGTKRNIIEIAIQEFAANGLAGARIDVIAEKTNSSKRMIYYYFGGKDGLYLRCLEESYRIVRSGEAQLDLADLAPKNALMRLIEFTFDHHETHSDFIRMVMIENINNGKYLERSDTIREMNSAAIDRLAGIYDRGVSEGVFRSGLKSIDLHWHISALCFFNVSNRATFTNIFEKNVDPVAVHATRRSQVVEMILKFVDVSLI